MLGRCYNKNTEYYRWYGGKGITVAEEWKVFLPFREWALANGYAEGLSLDRIDSSMDYKPNNCQWITRRENTKRMTAEHRVWNLTCFGETKSVDEWVLDPRCKCDKPSALRMRVSRGWDDVKAITTPTQNHHNYKPKKI